MSTIDPTSVHPEHDQPTPENIDDWSDQQIAAYNSAKAREHEQRAKQHAADLSREQRGALDQLATLVDDDAEPATETVEIGEAELTVTTKIDGELEDRLDRISRLQDTEEPGAIGESKDLLIRAILGLIVADNETGRYTWRSRETWEAFYKEHGTEGLAAAFEALVEPAMQRREQRQSFREERPGARRSPDV